MLKTIVQQMKLRAKTRLGELAGCIAIFSDNHRHLQFPGDQQRLVSKFGG